MSADRHPGITRREVLKLAASLLLAPVDLAFPQLKPEASSVKPVDRLKERVDEYGFYIPSTSLEETRQNLERILAKSPEEITNADMFSAITDSFASLGTNEIETEPDESELYGIGKLSDLDEVWLHHSPQVEDIVISSYNSSEYVDRSRKEVAWIAPTGNNDDPPYSFDFHRDVDGKVTLIRVNIEADVEAPYKIPSSEKIRFLTALQQEVDSKIPKAA